MARKISRATSVSVRFPARLLDDIDVELEKGEFSSTSQAIIKCTEVGLEAIRYKEMMSDPVKAAEFAAKMQEAIKEDEVGRWAETLTRDQLDGFVMLLKMEKEKRYSIRKFV